MDPAITRQVPTALDSGEATDNLSPEKKSPSKFDAVRSQIGQQNKADDAGPNATQAVTNQQELQKVELRKKLNTNPSRKPADVFGEDLKTTGSALNHLKQWVSAMPPSSALDQVQKRLTDLDDQFQKAGTTIQGMSGPASPKQLLALQMDMNNLSENLAVVSKMADEVTSGIKSILQTQV